MGIVVPAVDGQRLLVRLEEVDEPDLQKGICLQGAGLRLEAVVEGGQRLEALQPQRMLTSVEDCCCCRWCWVLVLGASKEGDDLVPLCLQMLSHRCGT